MIEEFKKLVDKYSSEVDSIIEAMYNYDGHGNKKNDTISHYLTSSRRFLTLINSIVDYYITCPKLDKAKFPIVYIPNVPEWGKRIVLRFLIFKISLYYNSQKRVEFKNRIKGKPTIKGDKEGERYKKYEIPFRKYVRQISEQLTENYLGEDGHKNLIFCSANDLNASTIGKNKFIEEFYGPIDDVCFDSNLTICPGITAKDVRTQIKDSNKDTKIDNIFVLYTNNEQCNSLNDASIARIKSDIKNCFVFVFSDRPFYLNRIRNRCASFGHRFPMLTDKEALKNKHFITVTEEESRYLFNLKYNDSHIHIPDNQLFFNDQISNLFDNSEHPILDRIHFSLCLDDIQEKEYINVLKDKYPNYSQEFYQLSIEYQLDFAKSEIIPKIKNFLKKAVNVAIILPYDSTIQEQQMFKRLLNEYTSLRFYNLSDLKSELNNKNKIKEPYILNFVYRPHYANRLYPKYPNSFDPYMLKDNQYILDIINGFVFENMYLWELYEYEDMVYHILDSEFRHKYIGMPPRPEKPKIDRVSGEIDFDDERTSPRTIKSYKVTFKDKTNSKIPETEFVVAEIASEKRIYRIRELAEIKDSDIKLQKLKDLEETLDVFIQQKTDEAYTKEKTIRDHLYKCELINENERDSKELLWKILLSHKVNELGIKTVYTEIMSGLEGRYKIQENTFKHWCDKDSIMILPLQKVCQKRLIEYLHLDTTPYLSIIRSQKIARVNSTKQLNYMKVQFMLNMLFQDIDDNKYNEFVDSDINDILQFEKISDLIALVEMITDSIRLKPVESIK